MISHAWQLLLGYILILLYTLKVATGLQQPIADEHSTAKTVSICSDPVTENGPFRKKDEESTSAGDGEEAAADEELQAVAARIVDDVVQLAAQAADEKAAAALESQVQSIRETLESTLPHHNSPRVNRAPPERLPSILIDTVPSMPPSPTEWPPPPPEATIIEEDEPIEEEPADSHPEDTSPSEGIQAYATNYIEDILIKAMEIAEEKQKTEEEMMIREVATKVVDDVISRASESAAERLTEGLTFPGMPSIQIDTVASMPASPDDEVSTEMSQPKDASKQETRRQQQVPEITYMQYEDENEPLEEKFKQPLVKFADAPDEVRELAAACVKDVVSKAIIMAEEKISSTVPFSFDGDLMKVNGPWYIRMREALMRVLRSACFCTPRRDDS